MDEIKRIPIAAVASEFQIRVRSGSANCPFNDHRDQNPSFQLLMRNNAWKCYGCGRKGSNIDLVMQLNGWDFSTAAEWLQNKFLFRIPTRRAISAVKSKPETKVETESDHLPDQEVYNWLLKNSPLKEDGAKYLLSRHISEATAKAFQVGQIGDAVQLLGSAMAAYGSLRLERSGLIKKLPSGSHSKLAFASNSLLFPFLDDERCHYLQARVIGPALNGPRWRNLYGLKPPIYNVAALHNAGKIYLCEGITDVLSASELGRTAFALLGANADVTSDAFYLLRGRTVYILPDNDRGGRIMSKRLTVLFSKLGVDAVFQRWPAGIKDANEYLAAVRS